MTKELSVTRREEKDLKSLKIIKNQRKKLTSLGLYPKKFTMPTHLQFEMTARCNLRCKHCYNMSSMDRTDIMTPFLWKKTCDDIVRHGGIFQATFSGGEPLLLGNDLFDVMDILNADNTLLSLLTNGLLVNNNTIQRLKNYKMYWTQISLDSFIPDHHDEFRGLKGAWHKSANAIYKLANSGIPVRIASSITKSDINNLEKFVQMAINLGASYLAIGEIMPSGNAFSNKGLFLDIEDRLLFEKEILRLQKKYQGNIYISSSGAQRTQLQYAAIGTLEGGIIRPDGTVRLDCTCPFVIGDVTKQSIYEIWKEKHDAWSNPLVIKYIESCDFESGNSEFLKNFLDSDMVI